MKAPAQHRFVMLATLLALAASTAHAGTFTQLNWTNDADSLVSSSKVYTHTINFSGEPINPVNGVAFTSTASTTGGNYTLAGTTNAFGGNGSNLPGGTFSGQIVDDFFYGETPFGGTASLTLTGLNPGQYYTTTFYSEGFGGAGGRLTNITTSDDGATTLVDQNAAGNDNGLLVRYTYAAPDSGSMVFTFDAVSAGDTWHHYGFSNEILRKEITTLFNTGEETTLGIDADTGNIVAEIDDHWTIQSDADTQTGGPEAFVVQTNPGWFANDSESRWISGRAAANAIANVGTYNYSTTFDLASEFDTGSVLLNINLATDDSLADILINGNSTGIALAAGFGGYTNVLIDARDYDFFVTGANTLTFAVVNGGSSANPTAFRAALSGSAGFVVPAPAALPAGLVGVALVLARRRR